MAYRYRRFNLGGIRLVVRCELNGWTTKNEQEQLFTCYALNEWDPRLPGSMPWREKIDIQRGAVLGNEIKNNSCKLAKWTAQSILADADMMKIGFVSRVKPTKETEHAILATQSYKPKDFANQIYLSPVNLWGIIKMFCELLHKKEDGKYVLIKDPNKSTVRLYSVPLNTFEDEVDEEGNEDGEGDEDGDRDD